MSKNDFPRIFDTCPVCGSKETVTNVAAQELFETGAIKKGSILARRREVTPMVEPSQVSISLPAIITSFDVCYGCGKEYVTRVEYQNLPVRMEIKPGPFPFGNIPMGKG